jgi:hypothetical protein
MLGGVSCWAGSTWSSAEGPRKPRQTDGGNEQRVSRGYGSPFDEFFARHIQGVAGR